MAPTPRFEAFAIATPASMQFATRATMQFIDDFWFPRPITNGYMLRIIQVSPANHKWVHASNNSASNIPTLLFPPANGYRYPKHSSQGPTPARLLPLVQMRNGHPCIYKPSWATTHTYTWLNLVGLCSQFAVCACETTTTSRTPGKAASSQFRWFLQGRSKFQAML